MGLVHLLQAVRNAVYISHSPVASFELSSLKNLAGSPTYYTWDPGVKN